MEDSVEIRSGNIVYLLDKSDNLVCDNDDMPILYQVTAVYRDFKKVGLVTYYGEYVGTHSIDSVIYLSDGPLFRKEDYEEESTVIWIDGEDVYEGVIETLGESTAMMTQIKKLLPINHKVRVPYWKIPDGRKVRVTSKISHKEKDELLGGE